MIAASDIERMSVVERLQAIELLWNSISRSGDAVASPSWHQDVLSVRRAKVDAGEGKFLSISELRSRLNQSHS
jgi:putative addiction module component (TIGR02574 family)